MKIIITGAYAIGTHLARLLSRNHEDITVIDEDEERLARIGSDFDLLTMQAYPTSVKVPLFKGFSSRNQSSSLFSLHSLSWPKS